MPIPILTGTLYPVGVRAVGFTVVPRLRTTSFTWMSTHLLIPCLSEQIKCVLNKSRFAPLPIQKMKNPIQTEKIRATLADLAKGEFKEELEKIKGYCMGIIEMRDTLLIELDEITNGEIDD